MSDDAGTWTLREARAFAKKYDMLAAKCKTCGKPHLWKYGQYLNAPETCGRDACENKEKTVATA